MLASYGHVRDLPSKNGSVLPDKDFEMHWDVEPKAAKRLGIDSDILESQLAHAKRGEVQAAYDRTTFTEARRDAMQKWADWLDELADLSSGRPVAA